MTTRVLLSFLAISLLCSCASMRGKTMNQMDGTPIPPEEGDNNYARDLVPPPLEAATPKKQKNPYIQLTGYFMRPPMFVDNADHLKFQRCLPVTIEQTQFHKGNARIFVRQGENRFAIKGINRKILVNKGIRIPMLDKYFMKRLDIAGHGRAIAVEGNKLCAGQFAQKMPKKEFLFLSGDPDSTKKQTTSAGPVEELHYKSDGSSAPMTYYFLAGQLYSWKN